MSEEKRTFKEFLQEEVFSAKIKEHLTSLPAKLCYLGMILGFLAGFLVFGLRYSNNTSQRETTTTISTQLGISTNDYAVVDQLPGDHIRTLVVNIIENERLTIEKKQNYTLRRDGDIEYTTIRTAAQEDQDKGAYCFDIRYSLVSSANDNRITYTNRVFLNEDQTAITAITQTPTKKE